MKLCLKKISMNIKKETLMTNIDKQAMIFAGHLCPYCSGGTVYLDSKEVYKRSYGMIYLCRPCKAWVGVHKGTDNAIGRIANAELREEKKLAHYYFDKLWNAKIAAGTKKGKARGKAYIWLSKQVGTPPEETHIGYFDMELCQKVVEVCKPFVEKLKL